MEDKFKPEPRLVDRLIIAHISACGSHPIGESIREAYTYWKGLFDKYNEAATDPGRKDRLMFPLKMGCRICYAKVWYWNLKAERESAK